MKENKPSIYNSVYTKENLPEMCQECVHYGDDVCEACLEDYYEKKLKDDRTSNS